VARTAFFADLEAQIGPFKRSDVLSAFWQLAGSRAEVEIRRTAESKPTGARLQAAVNLLQRSVQAIAGPIERIAQLEGELQQAIFQAYGLDGEEIRTILDTLPPRDPLIVARSTFALAGGGEAREGADARA
jgi:hypothetical protein